MASPKFDEAEFRQTLERMVSKEDFGETNPTPAFDSKLHADLVDAAIEGRKISDYRIALESCGFLFVPAERLPPYKNGQPRTAGEWRNSKLRMAFTDTDILAGYKTPEEFVTWIENWRKAKRLQAAGLILGTKLRRR